MGSLYPFKKYVILYRRVFISVSAATESVGEYRYTIESVMHDRCNDRPPVTFPATGHCHCPLAGTHSNPAEEKRLRLPERLFVP